MLSKDISNAVLHGPSGNMIFRHEVEKLERNLFLECGKLTAFVILNGGSGLLVMNSMLYEMLTDQQVKIDLDSLPQSEDSEFIKQINESSDEDSFKAAIDDHSDWILEQGLFPANFKKRYGEKDEAVMCLLKNLLYYRPHAEIMQFIKGLNAVGDFHKSEMLIAPDYYKRLFVYTHSNLTFDSFRRLYKVNFSPEGSNNRNLESDTIYCLEAFLADCAEGESDVTLSDALMFWTGAASEPTMGFEKSLEVEFVSGERKIQVAHTCGLILHLIRGSSEPDLFKEDFEKAIKWCLGFHLC